MSVWDVARCPQSGATHGFAALPPGREWLPRDRESECSDRAYGKPSRIVASGAPNCGLQQITEVRLGIVSARVPAGNPAKATEKTCLQNTDLPQTPATLTPEMPERAASLSKTAARFAASYPENTVAPKNRHDGRRNTFESGVSLGVETQRLEIQGRPLPTAGRDPNVQPAVEPDARQGGLPALLRRCRSFA